MLSIPEKIVAVLCDTPGVVIPHEIIWEKCWDDSAYQREVCYGALRTGISSARKLLMSGDISSIGGYGYVYFKRVQI